jgi:hypothetical protein
MHELFGTTKHLRDEKQTFYSELIHIATEKNYNRGWASHKFKQKFGVWPKGLKEIGIPPTIKTVNWIKSKNIAWAKRIKGVRV